MREELGFAPELSYQLPSAVQMLKLQHAHGLLDSAADQFFHEIARMAAVCCDAPVSLISLVDRERRWFKSHVGLMAEATQHMLSLCSHVLPVPEQVMIVPDARLDSRFAGHPLVGEESGIVFYAGAPLMSATGETIGALYIADYKSRDLSSSQCEMLSTLASQVRRQLELRRSLMTLEATIELQTLYVDQLERELQGLEEENATDPLTGLGNRRGFEERLSAELARAARDDDAVALMMLDVDFFKHYNDTYGHPAGDVVLQQLAGVMRRSCRTQDFAARVGGEEFAVLLPSTTREGAFVIAERLRRNVQREMWPNCPVTVSIGVALSKVGNHNASQLTKEADVSLYRSKRNGRNRVTLAEDAMAL